MKNGVAAVLRVFRRIEWVCLVMPMAVLVLLVFIQIITRNLFRWSISWLEEFGRYVFVFCTFLGASLAIGSDGHPKMTAILQAVPRLARYVMLIAGNAICCASCFLIAYYGYVQTTRQIASGAMSTALPIPMYVPYLIIPIGLATSGVRYAIAICKNVSGLASQRRGRLIIAPTKERRNDE